MRAGIIWLMLKHKLRVISLFEEYLLSSLGRCALFHTVADSSTSEDPFAELQIVEEERSILSSKSVKI